MKSGNLLRYVILSSLIGFSIACESKKENKFPIFTYADSLDFQKTQAMEAKLGEGFQVALWAPEKLLAGPVGISIDHSGTVYLSETARRKSSDIDIRSHRDWMTDDLSLYSITATRDFHLKKLATELSDQNTWQEDLNQDSIHDFRDLEVESERIRVLRDEDGNGEAEVSHIFAADFKEMLTGVAGSVLVHDGKVYLTAAPDMWQLEDTDGDGDFDEKKSLSHGYGIHIAFAGHDMSGLTVGPDGKIYWSIGDIGVNTTDANGKNWPYPHEGAVMRINPDGTDFEVFAHGLRNPQEIAFDKYGNLISVDNDGDHQGERERYVHILEGSDTGWRIHWQFGKYNDPQNAYKIWMDEKLYLPQFPGRPAYALPPLALAPNGPAGLAYNPGTAFYEEWEDYFFASYFTGSIANSKIEAFKLSPKGASFQLEDEQFVMNGIQSTGVNFGPDGSLYMADWMEGYAKKDVGRVWKLDTEKKHASQQQTQDILVKGFSKLEKEELQALMAYSDMRVRMEAQFELVKRKEKTALTKVLANKENQLARLHAIWGIGQLAREDKSETEVLLTYLDDADAEVRAQTAKVIGDARYAPAFDRLVPQLKDTSARAQYFAAEALGKIGNPAAFDGLVDLLEKTGESDPHLRHGIVYALSRIGVEEELGKLSSHNSEAVRVGAVVALRELRSSQLSRFLQDDSWKVMNEAARSIYDDQSVEASLKDLAASLGKNSVKTEAYLRRAINANLRIGGTDAANRLRNFIDDEGNAEAMRADAVWALAYWTDIPVLDRLEGIYRETASHSGNEILPAMEGLVEKLMKEGEKMKIAGIEMMGRLGMTDQDARLFALTSDKNETEDIRRAGLRSLIRMKSPRAEGAIEIALGDEKEGLRKEAQSLINEMEIEESEKLALLAKALEFGSTGERQTIFAGLGKIHTEDARNLIASWMDKLEAGKVEAGIQLDVLDAATAQENEALAQRVEAYYEGLNAQDDLGEYRVSLQGGNRRNGMRLFYIHESAQCTRCHQLEGDAVLAGPALGGIASQLNRQQLLEALVLPSKRISPGYGKEGVPSAMIPMQNFLTKNEIRDVVEFLNSLK
ncbi:MAG: PVC-type heme-binding CxxCH protein [Bacteroidota bacterium]